MNFGLHEVRVGDAESVLRTKMLRVDGVGVVHEVVDLVGEVTGADIATIRSPSPASGSRAGPWDGVTAAGPSRPRLPPPDHQACGAPPRGDPGGVPTALPFGFAGAAALP